MQNSKAVILCNRNNLKDQLQPAEQYVLSVSLVYFVEVCQSFAARITELSQNTVSTQRGAPCPMQQVSTGLGIARSSSKFLRPKPNKWNIIAVHFIYVGLVLNWVVFSDISAAVFDSIWLECTENFKLLEGKM